MKSLWGNDFTDNLAGISAMNWHPSLVDGLGGANSVIHRQ
jgi:hypothetical protein